MHLARLHPTRTLAFRPRALLLAVALAFATGAHAQAAVSDALLAVESNRTNIVDGVIERFGAPLARLGIDSGPLRAQLMALRADQLLAASLVRDLAALDLTRPAGSEALQHYVAIEPAALRGFTGLADALAYVARIDGALKLLTPVQLAALRAGPPGEDTVVGFFADASRVTRTVTVLADSGLRLKDGSGTGPQSWIGYTGGNNQATAQGSAVMAGLNNTASGPVSAVISGAGNVASGQGALIGGGDLHDAQGNYSVIVGGYGNTTAASDAVIVGGAFNENLGRRSLLGAGARNRIAPEASYSFIGGGGRDTDVGTGGAGTNAKDNVAFSKWTFIGGGSGNRAGVNGLATESAHAAVVGGSGNTASGAFSFVGGGQSNLVTEPGGVVGGGYLNLVAAQGSGVVAGINNYVPGGFSFIGGGSCNQASGSFSTVAGGGSGTGSETSPCFDPVANLQYGNWAGGEHSAVGGGNFNRAFSQGATVAGGISNEATGQYSTIAGGFTNKASELHSAVLGGAGNVASGYIASVLGGLTNTASGTGSAVLGGELNTASGGYSVAAGRRAVAAASGAFVFADTTDATFTVATANSFNVRASGGVYLYTKGDLSFGAKLEPNATAWSTLSDRNAKTDIAPVRVLDVLARVVAMPVSTWRYTADEYRTPHMGPMAQDFRRLFGLGRDDRTISTLDMDGVTLAAIQGLNAKLEAENRSLRAALADERARRELEMRELRAELRALAARTR